jgi:hypothetical protein
MALATNLPCVSKSVNVKNAAELADAAAMFVVVWAKLKLSRHNQRSSLLRRQTF